MLVDIAATDYLDWPGTADDVRISDRYFLGGDSFRGFAARGVGPRDTATDDSLGGSGNERILG